jgi:hypothetical protein
MQSSWRPYKSGGEIEQDVPLASSRDGLLFEWWSKHYVPDNMQPAKRSKTAGIRWTSKLESRSHKFLN